MTGMCMGSGQVLLVTVTVTTIYITYMIRHVPGVLSGG